MSGGGGKTPKFEPTSPAPTAQDQAVESAKADIRRKRRRSFSRRDTRVATPQQVNVNQNLQEELG